MSGAWPKRVMVPSGCFVERMYWAEYIELSQLPTMGLSDPAGDDQMRSMPAGRSSSSHLTFVVTSPLPKKNRYCAILRSTASVRTWPLQENSTLPIRNDALPVPTR
jgi:hypothetical protein